MCIIRCVMYHPCPIAPSFQHHHSCHLVLANWTFHHVFTPLTPRTIIYAVHMTGYVWEHVSFDIIGGTFVDGVWLCMTHPHACHLLTHVGFYIIRLYLPECCVSSFIVLCSLTSSPLYYFSGNGSWNKCGSPQWYKAGWWGGMQGHTRTCACARTRTHTCTQAHTCTLTCGHTSTACVCICSSRFLEPLSPPSLCDLTDL